MFLKITTSGNDVSAEVAAAKNHEQKLATVNIDPIEQGITNSSVIVNAVTSQSDSWTPLIDRLTKLMHVADQIAEVRLDNSGGSFPWN